MRIRPPRGTRKPRRSARESLQRGIFIIPTLFTVGNMACGFASVINALHDRYELAGWLLLAAGVFDLLDGRIARLTHTTSDFGKEYDSLADVVSFGLAPAILAYQWALRGLGRWGWAAAFLFLVAGSVRLARFNLIASKGDRRFFVGLPIPAGAAALTIPVLLWPQALDVHRWGWVVFCYVLLIAFLMVSTIPYRSFKDANLRQRWPATAFFLIALVIAMIVLLREHCLAGLLAVYLFSGPMERLARAFRAKPAASAPGHGQSEVTGGSSSSAEHS
jgi:CDP-diacylglycerol---serine O-phosphatidyltransferase